MSQPSGSENNINKNKNSSQSKAERAAAKNAERARIAQQKAAIRAERRRLALLRRRRRLRLDDVTVVQESALRKAIVGSVVGNLMEWYDVGVYGYVAVILGKVFLPDVEGHIQNLFSLGVFAVTFIARPLGGIILGQLGDRLGRKEVLAFTLLMMAGATFLIGVLPTYAAVGVIAPILLILLKLIQGFSTGGEYAGATTFITEYAPDKKRGFYASLLDWGSYIGFAIGAAFVSVLQLNVSDAFMESWGWRIPFMVALPLGVIALLFRSRIEDTPAFVEAQANEGDATKSDPVPAVGEVEDAIRLGEEEPQGLKGLVRNYWRELLTAFVLVAAANTTAYALTSYMPTYLSTTLDYDPVHGNLLTLPVLVLLAFMVPLSGWISDHVGRRTVLFAGSISAIVLAVPSFLLMAHGAIWSTLLGLFLLAIPVALYVGNLASSLPALFPTSSRYGGMGIAYNAAVAIFGGTAGFIMEALVTATGIALAPAFWVIATSAAGFVAVIFLKESARQPLPGSMPSVATEEEAVALVETQEENPDINVTEIFEQAPVHLVDQQPTVAEAKAEVQVALEAEAEAREAVRKAKLVTAAARQAVVEARKAEAEAESESEAASQDQTGSQSQVADKQPEANDN
ncbi:MAG: MFS transporter [Bifidobacterium tsurumiense]|uniref:MFS transporter n=1 Tax=Bifidobacterium tsurumiense TaxID=356829 RepID=UPI002A7F6D06|nr:MFS transporter [Bifidobacterium tsurumiense]MDY4677903.1 MFS transporter [Bifidobacterium tsurumiense]